MSDSLRAPAPVDETAAAFVERAGLLFEASGGPRAAGRMLGWLLVSDPPEQSAEQLSRALQASSGGVSTSARWLVQAGYVERITVAGDRRYYLRVRPNAWTRALDSQLATMRQFRELADEGLTVLEGAPVAHRRRLEEMRELFGFLEEQFPALVRRYHAERGDT